MFHIHRQFFVVLPIFLQCVGRKQQPTWHRRHFHRNLVECSFDNEALSRVLCICLETQEVSMSNKGGIITACYKKFRTNISPFQNMKWQNCSPWEHMFPESVPKFCSMLAWLPLVCNGCSLLCEQFPTSLSCIVHEESALFSGQEVSVRIFCKPACIVHIIIERESSHSKT